LAGRKLASICILLLSFSLADAQELRVDARAGWNGVFAADRAVPLVVTVENTGPRASATVSVTAEVGRAPAGRQTIVLSSPTQLPSHGARRVFFVIPAPAFRSPLVVSVEVSGRQAARTGVDLWGAAAPESLVVCLSSDISLDFIGAQGGGGRVVYPHTEDLPESWEGYDGVAKVVVHDLALHDIGSRQAYALRQWVTAGGTLVVSGGTAAVELQRSRIAELLPVEIRGLTEGRGLHGLAPLGAGSRPPAGPCVLARTELREGRVLALQDGVILAAERGLGRGRVVFLAFDCALPAIAAWPGFASFWHSLPSGEPFADPAPLGPDPAADPWLRSSFDTPRLALPRPAAALAFAAGLLALLLPVCLLWTGRRLTAAARGGILLGVIALGSAAAFLLFHRILFCPEPVVLRASLTEMTSGGGIARVTERVGVFSPVAGEADITVPGRGVLVRESAQQRRHLHVSAGDDTVLAGIDLPRFGARLFLLEALRPMDISVSLDNGASSVRIVNGSPRTLSDCRLAAGGRLYSLGTIAPGFSGRRTLQPTEGPPTDARRLAFRETAAGGGAGRGGSRGPVMYAWLDGSPLAGAPGAGIQTAGRGGLHLLEVEAR
jgi:hypothetical protein